MTLNGTRHCLIAGNTIRNAGGFSGSGVAVHGGFHNGVVGNDISSVGCHGVAIDGGDRRKLQAAENYADNNYIHHVGVFFKRGVGVNLQGVGNRVSHNLIHDGPDMGIEFAGNNLVIECNEIRHMALEIEDTGAVYTGGRDWLSSRGSVIRGNYFHDMIGWGANFDRREPPKLIWNVYLDDNAGGVDVIGNILVRAPGEVHLHNGRDNLIENNILVGSRLQQIQYSGWTGDCGCWKEHFKTMVQGYEMVAHEPAWRQMRNMNIHPKDAVLPNGLIMSGNVFRRNIVSYDAPEAKLFQFHDVPWDHYESDYNLIYHCGLPCRPVRRSRARRFRETWSAIRASSGVNPANCPPAGNGARGRKTPLPPRSPATPRESARCESAAASASGAVDKRSIPPSAATRSRSNKAVSIA